jgi:hypothetical protein
MILAIVAQSCFFQVYIEKNHIFIGSGSITQRRSGTENDLILISQHLHLSNLQKRVPKNNENRVPFIRRKSQAHYETFKSILSLFRKNFY